jgi:mono/diheme cytochrome c family protein
MTFRSLALFGLLSAGCAQQMANQPRYDPLQKSDFYPDTMSARPLPAGVISRSYVDKDELLETGMVDGKPSDQFPFPVTKDVLERGRQRYNIFCSPCHDYVGTGKGMAAKRGFKRFPPSFHSETMRADPAGHFFDVITNGFGAMQPYANSIEARDRWAIVAYIRALQLSEWASAGDVPADQRQKLEAEKR